MMISTKGRYAVRIMIDLAKNIDNDYVSLRDIAKRQEISVKYLEAIISILNKNKLVTSMRGKTGGYRLAKEVEEYTIGEILRLTEGGLSPVNCLECQQEEGCQRSAICLTFPVWYNLDRLVNEYLDSVSLKDVVENRNMTYQLETVVDSKMI